MRHTFWNSKYQRPSCWWYSISGCKQGLARNHLAFWTCPWHLLSAFCNTKFRSRKKSKEVSEMTQRRAASHTVAYLWKPVKPQWQTVWYAAIRGGGGVRWEGLLVAACKAERQRVRRRWAALEQQQQMGLHVCLHRVESQGGRFKSFLYMLLITTNPPIQGEI